jgi:hypothetical protein
MAGELEQEDYEAGSAREKAQKAKLAAIESERARMAEERASLPIYAHRWASKTACAALSCAVVLWCALACPSTLAGALLVCC